MKKKDYEEYLNSEKWNQKRKAKLWVSEYTCELCNAKNAKLHVHHRTYDNVGGEKPNDLIVLCETCHQRFHGRPKDKDLSSQELNESMTVDKIIKRFIPDMRVQGMSDREIAEALMSLWFAVKLSHYDIILRMSEIDDATDLWKFARKKD